MGSLPARLLARELGGQPRLFAQVPPSLQRPIAEVLDAGGELKGAVLLGFTRAGDHLLSYTTAPVAAAEGREGLSLQLWTYAPGQRCRRLWSVPLFRAAHGVGAGGSGSSSEEEEADEEEQAFGGGTLLTVAETPDSGLLVVHGRACEPPCAAQSGGGDQLAEFLTLIPGPAHAAASHLKVAHLCYHSAPPHMAFNPHLFTSQICAGNSSGSSTTTAVAVHAGSSLRFVRVGVACSPPEQAVAASGGSNESSSSELGSPMQQPAVQPIMLESLTFASSSPGGTPQQQQQQQEGEQEEEQQGLGATPSAQQQAEAELRLRWGLVRCCSGWAAADGQAGLTLSSVQLAASPGEVDVERLAYAAVQQRGLPPSQLQDYSAAAPVCWGEWRARPGLLLLVVLRLGGPPRSAALLVHAAAAGSSRGAEVVEWMEAPFPWDSDPPLELARSAGMVGDVDCDHAAAFFSLLLRRQHCAPPSWHALPLVLSNRSVLEGGTSLAHVAHPWLPQAILGYGLSSGGGSSSRGRSRAA